MTAKSMTGFAQARRQVKGAQLTVNLKSVNHRGLDIHFHMPPAVDPFEPIARAAIRQRIARGHVQVQVRMEGETSEAGNLNRGLLERWKAAFDEASRVLGSGAGPDPNAALRVPGILAAERSFDWNEEIERGLREALDEAMDAFEAFREREGEATAAEIRGRAAAVREAVDKIEGIRESAAAQIRRRLEERMAELLAAIQIDPGRLAQEAAMMAERSDISEEIMRLRAHAQELIELTRADGERGKKLDFLLQEMNRESNTILSKTSGLGEQGLELTGYALSAKAEIDKMREQALNLE